MATSDTPVVFCLLGPIEFDLASSFRTFSHTSKSKLPEHPLILRKPSVQYLGEELETLSLGFRWHVGWCDPDARLQQLWVEKRKAEPLRLVLGSNTYTGKWLIESVDSTLTQTTPNGETLSIEATAKLKEAGPQPRKRKKGGAATRTNGLAAFARRI